MDAELRRRIYTALASQRAPSLQRLASAVKGADGTAIACWGDLADAAHASLQSDAERLALWHALLDAGDIRALMLFIDLQRDRPDVLREMLADAARVPFTVQCALVTAPEVARLGAPAPAGLCAAARELIGAPEERRSRDRAVYEAHMSALRAQRATATDANTDLPTRPEAPSTATDASTTTPT
jgi:hypothetical protein